MGGSEYVDTHLGTYFGVFRNMSMGISEHVDG